MTKNKKKLIGAVISGAAVLLLSFTVDWNQTILGLSDADPYKLLAGSTAVTLSYFFFGWRWHLILNLKEQCAVCYWVSFRNLTIGHFFNAFLPLRAGDLIRIYTLKKYIDGSSAYILGAVVFEKVIDVSILIVALAGILAVQRSIIGSATILVSIVIMVAIWTAIAKARSLELLPHQNQNPSRIFSMRAKFFYYLVRTLDAFVGFYKDIPSTHSHLLPVLVTSILSWGVFLSGYIFILWAFHVTETFLGSAAIVAVTNLGAVTPSSPASIGVYEGLCVAALIPFGVSISIATAIAIISHLIAISAQVILGGISLAIEHSCKAN